MEVALALILFYTIMLQIKNYQLQRELDTIEDLVEDLKAIIDIQEEEADQRRKSEVRTELNLDGLFP